MLIGGTWQRAASGQAEDVTSPYDGAVTGTVPVASALGFTVRQPVGIGKEGRRSAVAEMTGVKTVILDGRPW